MKKFFIALSVLAALALGAVPSQALVGMPDDVPGFNIQQAFFVVSVSAVELAGGLDTAVVIQEIGNAPGAGQSASLRWHIYDVNSNHIADSSEPYTRNDVVPMSVASMIRTNVGLPGLAALLDETTFDVPVYIGYITWENRIVNAAGTRFYTNNLIAKMYLHDMERGQAAMVNLAAREYLPATIPGWVTSTTVGGGNGLLIPAAGVAVPAGGLHYYPATPFLASQGQAGTVTTHDGEFFADFGGVVADATPTYEAFSPNALAGSMQRERGYDAGDSMNPQIFGLNRPANPAALNYKKVRGPNTAAGAPTYYDSQLPPITNATGFALYPRYYIHNATADNYIFLWKSINAAVGDTWRIDLNIYDEDEIGISQFIAIPNELNVLDMRAILPPAHMASFPAAGWMSISIPDIFGAYPAAGSAPATAITRFDGVADVEFLGYNWQIANSADATLNWSGLYQVARDVNFATR